MRIGIGGLKWRPADFWAATMTEFFEAIHGHNDTQGGSEKKSEAPSANDMAALLAKYG